MNRCILALESDKEDIFQLQRAFQMAGIRDHLTVVRNRDEALCYLKGVGVYADRSKYPLPRLMLVDMVAEICGGFEVLHWIKAFMGDDPMIVIATGHSLSEAEGQRAYDLGANAVFQKPGDIEELSRLIISLEFVPAKSQADEA